MPNDDLFAFLFLLFFGDCSVQKICLSLLLLIIYLYQYKLRYLFCALIYNPMLSLFFCSNFSSFGHWELFQLAPVSFWYALILLFLFQLFLPFENKKYPELICIFPTSVLESTISPRNFGSFYCLMILRNRSLSTWCACCYQGASKPSQIYLYIYIIIINIVYWYTIIYSVYSTY